MIISYILIVDEKFLNVRQKVNEIESIGYLFI